MKAKLPALLKSLLLVSFLSIALSIEIILAVSFFQANADKFSIMPIVQFAQGWEKVWMWIFLAADAGYLVILGVLFAELALFLVRTMIVSAVRALSVLKGSDPDKTVAVIKKVSIFTLFRMMKVNTPLKSILVWFAVILLVLGSGWVAKKVLAANASLVYRTFVVANLEHDELTVDVAADIAAEAVYAIDVTAGVGNVQIYAVEDTTEISVYFDYDTQAEKASLVWSIDTDLKRVTVVFSPDAATYVPYVDPLPGLVRIYVPATLQIGAVTVALSAYGSLTVDYLAFDRLDADVAIGAISVAGRNLAVGDLVLVSRGGSVSVILDACTSVNVVLTFGADLNAAAGTVAETFGVQATGGSDLFVYATKAAAVDVTASGANVELREVYAPAIQLTLTLSSRLLYVNGDKTYAYGAFDVNAIDSTVTLRGVPDDSNG